MNKEERIRDFLKGRLDEHQMQEMLEQFPEMEAEIGETKALMRALRNAAIDREVKEALDIRSSERAVKRSLMRKVIFQMAIAALFSLVALFSYLSFSKLYFNDYLVVPSKARGYSENVYRSNSPFDLFQEGRNAFLSGEFNVAVMSFEKVLRSEEVFRPYFKESVQWNLCVSYLMNEEPEKALLIYRELERIENPKYEVSLLTRIKIRWQIALKLFTSDKK